MLPPFNDPALPSRLPDSCRRRTLAAAKNASTVTLSWSSAAIFLNHGTQSLPPPSYPIPRTHTSKIGRVATHSATVAYRLTTYVFSICVPTPRSTASAGTFRQDPSLRRVAYICVICLNKLTCAPSNR